MRVINYQPKEIHLLVLLFTLAFALRVIGVSSDSLWTDEIHSLNVARESRLVNAGVPHDQHPPLYYLLLQGTTALGTSEFWLRIPSALFGTLGVAFMWRIGQVLGSKRLGLLAAALYAFAPLLVWYSREARMYGMASFIWAASLYFYFRTLCSNGRFDFLGLMLANLAAILTSYSSLALWFIQIALFYWFWQQFGGKRVRLVRWLFAQVGVVIGLIFWWPFFTIQISRSLVFIWQVPGPLAGLLDFSGTLQQTMLRGLVSAAVLIAAATIVSIWLTRRPISQGRMDQVTRLLLIGTLAMLAIVSLAGLVQRGLSIRRQLLVLLPPLILLAAWALSRTNYKWLAGLVIVLTFAASVGTVASPPYENWRDAINYTASSIGPEDVIVVAPGWNLDSLNYYFDKDRLSFGADDKGGLRRNENQSVEIDPVEAIYTPSRRVWLLVHSHPALFSYSQEIRSRLANAGQLVETVPFANHVALFIYEIK